MPLQIRAVPTIIYAPHPRAHTKQFVGTAYMSFNLMAQPCRRVTRRFWTHHTSRWQPARRTFSPPFITKLCCLLGNSVTAVIVSPLPLTISTLYTLVTHPSPSMANGTAPTECGRWILDPVLSGRVKVLLPLRIMYMNSIKNGTLSLICTARRLARYHRLGSPPLMPVFSVHGRV